MSRLRVLTAAVVLCQLASLVPTRAAADSDAQAQSIEHILKRLDALERRNDELTDQVESLLRQNEILRKQLMQREATVAPDAPAIAAPAAQTADDWTSRIRFKGDFRFRHESIANDAFTEDRTRETVRARFGAQIAVNDVVEAGIALASGGADPRGPSATLGSASSRKDVGLDLAYVSWRPYEGLTLTGGKMHQPFVRPGLSGFFDSELRPEGVAVSYAGSNGVFGSAFRFWLEERSASADSMLSGAQAGWRSTLGAVRLTTGVGYYDYDNVQGRAPGFGDGLVNELGNTLRGDGADARYAYDYDIGQLFVEAVFPINGVPVTLFADYARNAAAKNGLDTAYSAGFVFGAANAPGRWEAGAFTMRAEKDALFGQWIDSDFAGGVTDNAGYGYRIGWMALEKLLVNLTYLDTEYNVDVGARTDYRRWQVDFNLAF